MNDAVATRPSEAISQMSMKQLLAIYKEKTGKNIKKFSSLSAGRKQVLAALAQEATAIAKPKKETRGRKPADYKVKLKTTGASKVQAGSLRGKLIEWLAVQSDKESTLSVINKQFGRDMSGPIQKLVAARHLERSAK